MEVKDNLCPYCSTGTGVEFETKQLRYFMVCDLCTSSWVTMDQLDKNVEILNVLLSKAEQTDCE